MSASVPVVVSRFEVPPSHIVIIKLCRAAQRNAAHAACRLFIQSMAMCIRAMFKLRQALHDTCVSLPAGSCQGKRPQPLATLRVLRADFFRRVITRHDIGLGEAYMEGDFEVRSAHPFPMAHPTHTIGYRANTLIWWAVQACHKCASPASRQGL